MVYEGFMMGLLLLIPAVFTDFLLHGPKREYIRNSVKFLLLFQGLMMFIVLKFDVLPNPKVAKEFFNQPNDNVLDKTSNIIEIKQTTKYEHVLDPQPPKYEHILDPQPPKYEHVLDPQPPKYEHQRDYKGLLHLIVSELNRMLFILCVVTSWFSMNASITL
jgi:hypothetical protein